MRHTILTFLLLVVVVALVTACAPGESERIAALEATIADLEEEREEEGRLPTQEPYPTPTGQAAATPTPEEMRPSIIWTIQGSFLIAEDKVFTIENIAGGGVVRCFDITTGQQLWQWEEQWETRGALLIAGPEAVYVSRGGDRYYAIDSHTGKEKWKVSLHPELGTPFASGQDGDRLFIGLGERMGFGPEPFLTAVNKADGSVAWELTESTLVGQTDRVLLVRYGWLSPGYRGVDPERGEVLWELSEPFKYNSSIELAEDVFFNRFAPCEMGCYGPIMAYDIESGRELWRTAAKDLEEFLELSPTSLYAITSKWEPPLRVFDPKTGQERWTWPDIPPGRRHPSSYKNLFLGEFERVIIISDPELGFTWAVDATTGNVLWMNDDLVLDEVVGVSDAGTLLAWRHPFTGPSFLFGIDFTSGERKWRRELEIYRGVKGILLGSRYIYLTTDNVVFVDPESGEQINTLPLPCSVYSLSPKEDILLGEGLMCLLAIRLP